MDYSYDTFMVLFFPFESINHQTLFFFKHRQNTPAVTFTKPITCKTHLHALDTRTLIQRHLCSPGNSQSLAESLILVLEAK